MADCLIGLGSNVGDRSAQLDQAVDRICGCPHVSLCSASRYHETTPIGGPAGQNPFLNAAIRVTTELSPAQMLAWVGQAERELGRERLERWGPRSIDIDVLLYDLLIIASADLMIPHPRMAVRRFVLEPACEVGAEMVHAPTGWPLQRLLARLDDLPCYVAICCADQRRSTELVTAASQQMNAIPLISNSAQPVAATAQSPQVALRRELEVLVQRRNLLESINASSLQQRPVLSDFWLNQSLALARTWPPGPEREQLQRVCQTAVDQTPQPRFILHLNLAPANTSVPPAVTPARQASHQSTLASLAFQLRAQTATAGQGPVLSVAAKDLNAAFIELQGGIDAMR